MFKRLWCRVFHGSWHLYPSYDNDGRYCDKCSAFHPLPLDNASKDRAVR